MLTHEHQFKIKNDKIALPNIGEKFMRVFQSLFFRASFAVSLLILAGQAAAFDNFNECRMLFDEIKSNQASLSLDEPPLIERQYHGVDFAWSSDKKYLEVTKVHPTLTLSLNEKYDDWDDDFGDWYVDTVNGVSVHDLDEQKLEEALKSQKISIRFQSESGTVYELEKKEYTSVPVELTLSVEEISDINSKSSQFYSKFKVDSEWRVRSLIGIAQKVSLEGVKRDSNTDGSYYCTLPPSILASLDLYLPGVKPDRFKSGNETPSYLYYMDYSSPSWCDGYYVCSPDEAKRGVVTIREEATYAGVMKQDFQFQKFPFDQQAFSFLFRQSDFWGADNRVDLSESRWNEDSLVKSVVNIASQEWNFTKHGSGFGSDYDQFTGGRVPNLAMWFEADREFSYYISKLIIPIGFLLILCWVVFFLPLSELESRVTISIVCFLSLIAYYFVIDDDLPKLAYSTFIDTFILISYVFAGIPTIQTVFASYFLHDRQKEISANTDRIFRIAYLPAYLAACYLALVNYGLWNIASL
jgi:hypothetical protein